MTESLLQKLEEKMMLLLTEIEDARKQIQSLIQENSTLKTERKSIEEKLSDLNALLDTINTADIMNNVVTPALKPVLVQQG
jgi:regulator of replication initiation timing